ncbi:MAG: hypothetical protein ACI89L_001472 [Phycisphaerales bacterium]|jgi:hypothetical protein
MRHLSVLALALVASHAAADTTTWLTINNGSTTVSSSESELTSAFSQSGAGWTTESLSRGLAKNGVLGSLSRVNFSEIHNWNQPQTVAATSQVTYTNRITFSSADLALGTSMRVVIDLGLHGENFMFAESWGSAQGTADANLYVNVRNPTGTSYDRSLRQVLNSSGSMSSEESGTFIAVVANGSTIDLTVRLRTSAALSNSSLNSTGWVGPGSGSIVSDFGNTGGVSGITFATTSGQAITGSYTALDGGFDLYTVPSPASGLLLGGGALLAFRRRRG